MALSDGAAGVRLGGGLSAVNAPRTHGRSSIPVTLRRGFGQFETRVAPTSSEVANAGWTFATSIFLGNHEREPTRTVAGGKRLPRQAHRFPS